MWCFCHWSFTRTFSGNCSKSLDRRRFCRARARARHPRFRGLRSAKREATLRAIGVSCVFVKYQTLGLRTSANAHGSAIASIISSASAGSLTARERSIAPARVDKTFSAALRRSDPDSPEVTSDNNFSKSLTPLVYAVCMAPPRRPTSAPMDGSGQPVPGFSRCSIETYPSMIAFSASVAIPQPPSP